jgi:hypothetical protein
VLRRLGLLLLRLRACGLLPLGVCHDRFLVNAGISSLRLQTPPTRALLCGLRGVVSVR